MSNDQYASYLDTAIPNNNNVQGKKVNPAHARVGSTLTDGKSNDNSNQKQPNIDSLDKEVE